MHVYSELSPIGFNVVYTQLSQYRIAASDDMTASPFAIYNWELSHLGKHALSTDIKNQR